MPQPGAQVTIVSLGAGVGLLAAPIRSVTLLGSKEKLLWSQKPEGLVVTAPSKLPSNIAVTFKIQ